jgi:hypothetical protein
MLRSSDDRENKKIIGTYFLYTLKEKALDIPVNQHTVLQSNGNCVEGSPKKFLKRFWMIASC